MIFEEKMICGISHIKVPCKRCDEPIWTTKKNKLLGAFCDDCFDEPKSEKQGYIDPIFISEMQYHGW